jgi:hypothetical protein
LCDSQGVTAVAVKYVREMILSEGLAELDMSIQYHDTGSENERL